MLKWLLITVGMIFHCAQGAELPTAETRVKIFDRVVSEIVRIDGEGLPARQNRPEHWKTTVLQLREQAREANTAEGFGQVFKRLDATYPNLHAQVVLDDRFDAGAHRRRPKIAVRFAAEVIARNQKKFRYMVNSIETPMLKDFKESVRPAIGDEVISVNGQPMSFWSRSNFIYCKFPARLTCEMNIFDHFRKGLLAWEWGQPLEYTLQRNGRVWKIKVPFELPDAASPTASAPPSAQMIVSQAPPPQAEAECAVEADRYAGFKPVYKGLNICAYESADHAGLTVLSIASFRYRELPKEIKIQSLKDEVESFYQGYWRTKAPLTEKLIIDLIDNGGGDTPVEWYKIFYNRPFQEEYVQFKKTDEFENDLIRTDLFYGDNAKEIWFSELKKSGAYARIKKGQFLPRVPQFCVSEEQSCQKGLFQPLTNGFKGSVRILVNEWCISSCTGFVWSMKQELGRRVKVVGTPDSGDSGYARLYLDVYLDANLPEGFRSEVSPRAGRTKQNLPDGAFLRQQISATRSTDAKGRVISAHPTFVDVWVPVRYRHYDDSWEAKTFQAALKN